MSRSPWKLLAALLGVLGVCTVGACVGLALIGALPGSATAATPTRAPATPTSRPALATPTPAPVAVPGCGGGSVVIGHDARLRADLDQWNRIVGDANEVTRAWNTLLTTTGATGFAQAAGDPQLVAAADAYLAVAEAKLPLLTAETTSGRFGALAQREVSLAEARVQYATQFRQAIATSDPDAWNQSVAAAEAVEAADRELDAEVARQCDFWRAHR
jgi:hypothetical protein